MVGWNSSVLQQLCSPLHGLLIQTSSIPSSKPQERMPYACPLCPGVWQGPRLALPQPLLSLPFTKAGARACAKHGNYFHSRSNRCFGQQPRRSSAHQPSLSVTPRSSDSISLPFSFLYLSCKSPTSAKVQEVLPYRESRWEIPGQSWKQPKTSTVHNDIATTHFIWMHCFFIKPER